MGGWRGTLGTHDLKIGEVPVEGSDEGCSGEKRCSREVIHLTKPDVIRQWWEGYWWAARFM